MDIDLQRGNMLDVPNNPENKVNEYSLSLPLYYLWELHSAASYIFERVRIGI